MESQAIRTQLPTCLVGTYTYFHNFLIDYWIIQQHNALYYTLTKSYGKINVEINSAI
jgi:hypothetical protein